MSGQDPRGPLTPSYLRGVLTVEAELSVGGTGPDGWMRTASLVTEDPDGRLTRLRIPGQAFLRLIDGAELMLATSRAQSAELRQRHKPGQ